MLSRNFVGGQLFKGPAWPEELRKYSKLATPEPWLAKSIRDKEVTLEHSSLVNFGFKQIVFNKRTYSGWEALKNEDIENYGSAEHVSEEMVSSWLNSGIIRKAEPNELNEVVLNPVHCVNADEASRKLGKKPRFILHCKLNAVSKPQSTKLETVSNCLYRIIQLEEATVLDAKKAFWQIPIALSSQRLCGFKLFGTVWLPRVLMFGFSQGTHICNSLLRVPIYGT